MIKHFCIYALLTIVNFSIFAQSQSATDSANATISTALSSADTTQYEDTLNISPDAIYITVHRGEMNPYKKKYATSLYAMINASPDDVTSFWKNKFKNEYAVSLRPKKNMLIGKELNLLEISSRVITMYALIEQDQNQTKLNVCLEVNKGIFTDSASYPDDYNKLKKFIHNSVKQYYVDYYNGVLHNLDDQNQALLKQKQSVLTEKNKLNQSLIRNNQEVSSARKTKLANTTTVSKSEGRIRLNEERLRVYTDKIAALEAQMLEIKSQPDTSIAHSEAKLERIHLIEKDIKRTTSESAKAEKSILKADKSMTKADIKIEQSMDTIEQQIQEIDADKRSLEQKDKELKIINKKLDIKSIQMEQVNRKIRNIF